MKELVLARLEKLGADVEVYVWSTGAKIEVIVQDFVGFDDSWSEIYRDYNEDAIDEFKEWLEKECESFSGDYYEYYQFADFIVEIGYVSFDI